MPLTWCKGPVRYWICSKVGMSTAALWLERLDVHSSDQCFLAITQQ